MKKKITPEMYKLMAERILPFVHMTHSYLLCCQQNGIWKKEQIMELYCMFADKMIRECLDVFRSTNYIEEQDRWMIPSLRRKKKISALKAFNQMYNEEEFEKNFNFTFWMPFNIPKQILRDLIKETGKQANKDAKRLLEDSTNEVDVFGWLKNKAIHCCNSSTNANMISDMDFREKSIVNKVICPKPTKYLEK